MNYLLRRRVTTIAIQWRLKISQDHTCFAVVRAPPRFHRGPDHSSSPPFPSALAGLFKGCRCFGCSLFRVDFIYNTIAPSCYNHFWTCGGGYKVSKAFAR